MTNDPAAPAAPAAPATPSTPIFNPTMISTVARTRKRQRSPEYQVEVLLSEVFGEEVTSPQATLSEVYNPTQLASPQATLTARPLPPRLHPPRSPAPRSWPHPPRSRP